MKKLVCNLIIMGALAISTHSQAQHLLEALDAPSVGGVVGVGSNPTNPIGIGSGGERCDGGYWVGGVCTCPANPDIIRVSISGGWVCMPKQTVPDDEGCGITEDWDRCRAKADGVIIPKNN